MICIIHCTMNLEFGRICVDFYLEKVVSRKQNLVIKCHPEVCACVVIYNKMTIMERVLRV